MRRLCAALLPVILVAGACGSAISDQRAQVCAAAGQIGRARTIVGQASAADHQHYVSLAQALATQARIINGQAQQGLLAVTDLGVRQSAAWQDLEMAQLYVGQAANALLPEYWNTYGMTDDQIARADWQISQAQQTLPSQCFASQPSPPA